MSADRTFAGFLFEIIAAIVAKTHVPAWKDNSVYFLAETNRAIFISSRIQLTICNPIDFLSPEAHVVYLKGEMVTWNKYFYGSSLNEDILLRFFVLRK